MASQKAPPQHRISLEGSMAGILALLVDEREERIKDNRSARKTEALLADVGLAVEDIVAVSGKNAGAVRKTLQRSRTRK